MSEAPAQHLIIAGVTRAGTTSLYNYLAEHPGVCASSIKETRFFMDSDELKRLHRFEEGLGAYERFYKDCPNDAVRMEATPDYVYRPAVAKRIAESLPGAKVVVILREPVGRLISWHRYAIQNGLLDAGVSLGEYVQLMFDREADDQAPQHLRALREGRYARHLRPWVEAFGRDRLIVRGYSELMNDPASVVGDACRAVGIDPGFYDGYRFGVHNASRSVRWPGVQSAYRSLIWRFKPYVHDKPALRNALRSVRRATDAALGRSDAGRASKAAAAVDTLCDEDRRRLEDYYRDEPAALCELLDRAERVW